MKKILLSVVLATTLALTSCQFDDSDIWNKFGEMEESIRDHEQRISALEELCKQMNTNIEALQTLVNALEKRDYVTNVSEVRSNGEVIGYTISFAYSDTITIYHGQDGKDGANGADGKDGYTPQIGVMKDTDGIYYWTLDGEWLLDGKGNKIKAVGTDGADGKDGANGTNGSDGKDGQDGTNGTDGKDGADGKDGVTPQLKIENDYWYVSYDNGATWVQLGKATGEDGKDGQDGNDGADGSDGADGEDGDSIFKSVTQDDEYVYFNLADGTMITLPKHDKENIQFEDLQVKAICCKHWDTNNDGELSYAEAAAVETIGTVFSGNTNIIAFTELKYFTGITEIPTSAFSGCTALWKVILPENITIIGNYAFYNCTSLSRTNLPNEVTTIGDDAFCRCSVLTDVKFPKSLETIGSDAFYECQTLSNVILPNSVHTVGSNAFYECNEINIHIPNSVKIMDYALNHCGGTLTIDCDIITQNMLTGATFSRVIIGDNVSIIEKDAFHNHSFLHYIHIGKNVTTIGQGAFDGCYITEVDVSDLAKWYEIDHNYGLAVLVNNHTANLSLNGEPISLEGNIIIPNGVTKIGNCAFYGNSKITSVTIPNSVTSIGELSFYRCDNIKNITIPDSVISINKHSFYYCGALENLTIGSGCIYIEQAFYEGNDNLKVVYCRPAFPPAIYYYISSPYITKEFPSNAIIYVPRSSLNYYMQYSSYESNTVAITNWSQQISQIRPFDFE